MNRRFINILSSLLICLSLSARDTTYVHGAIQHDGLLDWKPVMYHSNSYVDFSVLYVNDSNAHHFRSLRATTRAELTQWPMPGYETDFAGHGISHLSLSSVFDFGEITIGDIYGQFGSGFILSLYEDRALGVDGTLRGTKFNLTPYKGIHLTLLGGKQRRYWNCYKDHAWGWNYTRDAVLGADLELHIDQWSQAMQNHDISWMVGGSYVSKYEAPDTIITFIDGQSYMYNMPRWIGAGDVRTQLHIKNFNLLLEYAYKANDPCTDNAYDYNPGHAALASFAYSRKGLSVLLQAKWTDNMSFRSDRLRTGLAGRLNHMPAFAQQHTYALAALYPYATQYSEAEYAVQGEIRYTAPRKTKLGGRYGTTFKLTGSHIRVRGKGEAYTDVNIELHKHISKNWYLNAMLMYQAYNQLVVEGHGDIIRSGIMVADARVHVTNNVSLRTELQYLYSPHHEGQWIFALCELGLYKCVTLSGQWMYNIGFAPDATNEHYYTFTATYTNGAHRLMAGYTKTREGFNCSGGICRYVPKMQGICVSYSFTW